MNNRLDQYLMRTIFTPLAMTLVIAIMLLVLDQMLRLFDFVVNRSGPAHLVWQMLANQLPEYLGLGLPIGMFMGVLFAFRKLSLSSELDALIASGVSLRRMLLPVMGLATLLMGMNFLVLAYVQPYSHYRYNELRFSVTTGALGFKIRPGETVNVRDNVTMYVDAERPNGELVGVFLKRCENRIDCTAVTAKSAVFYPSTTGDVLLLRMRDGRQIADVEGEHPMAIGFDELDIPIELPEFRERGGEKQEATINELFAEVIRGDPATSEHYQHFYAALHWRLVHTLSMLPLALFAISMGIADKRRDSWVGPVIAITTVVVYNELVESGQRVVASGDASPWLALWPTLFLFTALSIWLFRSISETPGGRALEPLENFWDDIRDVIVAVIRRFRPKPA